MVAGALFVVLALLAGVARVGGRAVDSTRAQSAADAAALAAVRLGTTGAQRVAAANGASVVSVTEIDGDVVVVVEVEGVRATARASEAP